MTCPPKKTIAIHLIDEDGKPVEGAYVSWTAFYSFCPYPNHVSDKSGWQYATDTSSDKNGSAILTENPEYVKVIYARQVLRKLVAIHGVDLDEFDKPITITMHPQCRVSGKLISTELEEINHPLGWTNVHLRLGKSCPLSCDSMEGEFHFFIPHGTYELEAYGSNLHFKSLKSL